MEERRTLNRYPGKQIFRRPESQPDPSGSPTAASSREKMSWSRFMMWVLVTLIAMFLLLLFFDRIIMPWYVKLGAVATVPEVVGMPYAEAEELLKEKGFEVKRTEPRYSDKFPAGTVLMQLPYGKAKTKEGRRIYLTESRGVEMIPMPNLIGLPLRDARIGLMRQGFDVGEIKYEYNDTIMRDLIFAQSIPQKVGARPGTKVDVMISRGPTTTYTLMPSLIGLTLDEARVRVENAGLALGVVRKKRSDFDANIVIEQGTPAYERTPHGGAVNVTIADPNAPVEESNETSDETPE